MTKSAVIARILPVAIVAAVLGTSLLMRPVSLNSVNAALCGYGYGYGTAPAVDAVSPTIGSTGGGTSVTLTGCGFTGATAVHFGTTAASTLTVNSDTKITTTSPAHAAGVVDVSVTTPLGTSPSQAGDQFTYAAPGTACTSAAIVGAPTAPQKSGTAVTFTASSTGCPTPLYEFWLRTSTSAWILAQSFSSSNTFNWDSTGAPVDTIFFGIWAKDAASSTATFDANSSIAYSITSPCGAASVSPASATVTQGSGAHDIITGGTTGCANPNPLFEFWLRTSSTDWILIQAFSTTATFDWNTTGAPPGVVYFGVWVKDAKSKTATFDANASTTVTVNAAVCTGVSATALPTTVVHGSGTHSTITAVASGCTNGTGQLYEFWLRTTSTDWVMVQAYSTTATFDWNSTGAPVTTVYIGVWAKDKNSSTATFDANTNVAIPVT
jgi:nicotinamide mononucleotide (NMN) deamidase PncC